MKRWIARVALPALLMGGAVAITPAAVSAEFGVYGGTYKEHSKCASVGAARVRSGTYTRYQCRPDEPFWTLRGYTGS